MAAVVDLRDGDLRRPRKAKGAGRPASLDPGLRVVPVTDGSLWAAAESLVYEVYREVGYCAPSPRKRVEELQPWADVSHFHVVVDESDQVLGAVRTILGGYEDLPIGQFERTDQTHEDPLCELSSLAIRPGARSTGVLEHLFRAGWLEAARSKATALVSVIDGWLLEVFNDSYGMPFVPIGAGRHYMGGDVVPAALPLVRSMYEEVYEVNPEFIRWNFELVEPSEFAVLDLPIILTDPVTPAPSETPANV